MSKFNLLLIVLAFFSIRLSAQDSNVLSSVDINKTCSLHWICPEIEQYQNLLSSFKDDDIRLYSVNAKDVFGVFPDSNNPNILSIESTARFVISNPLYKKENLFNHIVYWFKKNKSPWTQKIKVDIKNGELHSSTSIIVAEHAGMLEKHRITLYPELTIKLISADTLLVNLKASKYKDEQLGRGNVVGLSKSVEIASSYPFVENAKYQQTYAKAHVSSYQYFWKLISQLKNELNTNFSIDANYVAELRNLHYKDSLMQKYGQPTKVICGPKTNSLNNEIYLYEGSQKLVFGSMTIDFCDIISSELKDNPSFIPGTTNKVGGALVLFGIELGGSQSYTTPSKTQHKYMVDVKIDSLSSPLITFYFEENGTSANEFQASLEYIIRHKNEYQK